MAWTTDPRVMRIRRRHRVADIVVETLDGFARHLSGRDAAVLTYYGFLTIFPLFLAATTVLGFVLESRPDLEDDIVNSALGQVPFIGNQIATQTGHLTGNWWALTIGLAAALFASSKAFVGLQVAYDDVWDIPVDRRANFITKRVRALIGIAVIGGSQVANVALAAIVDQAGLPRISRILILLGGLAINVVVVATMYRYLTAARVRWQQVRAGALLAGVLYTAFQFAGTAVATRLLSSAETYG
ncbi:MAG: YihY/virulence factor BrkB family protein, partial [Ilumatobacteraceae bacterium]